MVFGAGEPDSRSLGPLSAIFPNAVSAESANWFRRFLVSAVGFAAYFRLCTGCCGLTGRIPPAVNPRAVPVAVPGSR